jgi:hypothetical protein
MEIIIEEHVLSGLIKKSKGNLGVKGGQVIKIGVYNVLAILPLLLPRSKME